MAPSSTSVPEGTSNWSTPGPAAFDFRSDVVTTPTASMLHAITQTTLLDDVFVEDPTTNSLEQFMTTLTGKASALLVLSGTMGNQLALRSHLTSPPHSILCDSRSHILVWEAGGAASLCGALVNGIVPANGRYVTVDDVGEHVELSDDVHACPTSLISLENTLNGVTLPLDECRKIKRWRDELHRRTGKYIPIHCDGARLWEAVSAVVAGRCGSSATCPPPASELASVLREYCDAFDSLSLCFSKGLGAPIGSILVGETKFIKKARHLRKAIGGGLRQAGVVAAPARVAVEETFLGGKLAATHARARQIAGMWEALGGELAEPVETNMVWLGGVREGRGGSSGAEAESGALKKIKEVRKSIAGHGKDVLVRVALEEGLRISGGRLVVHYQIGDEAVSRLKRAMERLINGDIAPREGRVEINGNSEVNIAERMDIKTE